MRQLFRLRESRQLSSQLSGQTSDQRNARSLQPERGNPSRYANARASAAREYRHGIIMCWLGSECIVFVVY
jgi:hypothetical protein